MSQVTQRGGIVTGTESKPSEDVIYAEAPMAKMFGFSTHLRSVTKGRASFSMGFSHFQIKPGGLGEWGDDERQIKQRFPSAPQIES